MPSHREGEWGWLLTGAQQERSFNHLSYPAYHLPRYMGWCGNIIIFLIILIISATRDIFLFFYFLLTGAEYFFAPNNKKSVSIAQLLYIKNSSSNIHRRIALTICIAIVRSLLPQLSGFQLTIYLLNSTGLLLFLFAVIITSQLLSRRILFTLST